MGLSMHGFQDLDAPEWQMRAEAGFEIGEHETIHGNATSGMLVGESVELRPWALRFGLAARRYLSEMFYLSGGAIAVRRVFELEEFSHSGRVKADKSHWSLELPLKAGVEYGRSSRISAYFEGGWVVRPDDETLLLPIGRYSLSYGLPGSDWTLGAGISFGWRP